MPVTSFRSVVEMFHHRVNSTPDSEAIFYRKEHSWNVMPWKEVGERTRRISCGLLALGLLPEQRCSILSSTRPEWVFADMAILAAAGATTTIYPSNTADECAYIINDSESVFVFVENEAQLEKLLALKSELHRVEKVITFNGKAGHDDWVMTLSSLEKLGSEWESSHKGEYEKTSASVGPDSLATLIYTSGTTGLPKGVMLTHDCWVYEGEAIDLLGVIFPSDRQFLFLPLAHSFAKVMEIAFIRLGVPTIIDGDMDSLVDNIAATRPTFMAAVPRVFEKVYNKVLSSARDGGKFKYSVFKWAVQVGRQVSRLRQKGQEPRGVLAARYAIADRLVFSRLRRGFGGRIRFFISGGAPLSPEIAEFFHAAGLLILEGYGLTETSAATFVNRPEHVRFGTVGPPLNGTEVKIADDGEILVKGRGVMKAYYKLPEDSAEVLDSRGWLHTGDIGVLDEAGYLKITDRKKDIIVTAGGKNVAPQNIENLLKTRCPYISHVVVHGDRRNFCTALISLNQETAGKWAERNGIQYENYEDLSSRPEIRQLVQEAINNVNSQLASYETIKKFALLDHELTQESGELTPSYKVKRRVVERNNKQILDSFYEGSMEKLE